MSEKPAETKIKRQAEIQEKIHELIKEFNQSVEDQENHTKLALFYVDIGINEDEFDIQLEDKAFHQLRGELEREPTIEEIDSRMQVLKPNFKAKPVIQGIGNLTLEIGLDGWFSSQSCW